MHLINVSLKKMLTVRNCCPQLYLGRSCFRIYNEDYHSLENVTLDGIILRKHLDLGNPFRQFVIGIYGSDPANYHLERLNLTQGSIVRELTLANESSSPHLIQGYGIYHGAYYRDQLKISSLTEFFDEGTDQEILMVYIQLANFLFDLSNAGHFLSDDPYQIFGVQRLDLEVNLVLSNERTLTTNTILKLRSADSLSDHSQRDYLTELLPKIQGWIPKVRSGNLDHLTSEVIILPKKIKVEKIRSHDTLFLTKMNPTCFQDYLQLSSWGLFYTQEPKSLILREKDVIKKLIRETLQIISRNRIKIEDIDEPDIGIGSGIYERKVIEHIKAWSVYREIYHWRRKIKFTTSFLTKISLKLAKIERRFNKAIEAFDRHRRSINDPNCSYLEAYDFFHR